MGCLWRVLGTHVGSVGCLLWLRKATNVRLFRTLATQLFKKGGEKISMEEWVAGFRKGEGRRLSVSTLIRAGKGAVGGCYGQEDGRGEAGREKNGDVRGEEEAKRRHKDTPTPCLSGRALGTQALARATHLFPACETHAYPWQMLKPRIPQL